MRVGVPYKLAYTGILVLDAFCDSTSIAVLRAESFEGVVQMAIIVWVKDSVDFSLKESCEGGLENTSLISDTGALQVISRRNLTRWRKRLLAKGGEGSTPKSQRVCESSVGLTWHEYTSVHKCAWTEGPPAIGTRVPSLTKQAQK